ncbi:MAG: DUF1565 domain-containing protein [Halobacteriales archaeon]|nr:DUF1565 domain-containing protein [Halobacteriales archaeon]
MPHGRITANFASAEAFVDAVRESLGEAAAADPYLIGEVGPYGPGYDDEVTDAYRRFAGVFDAVINNPWDPGGGEVDWATAFEKNFDGLVGGRLWADELGVDFVPLVYPGWSPATNACWDTNERVPRSPRHLAQLLQAAALTTTAGRLRINSFTTGRMDADRTGYARGRGVRAGYLEAVRSTQSAPAMDFHGQSEYYVSPNGSDHNPGSESAPLGTVQHALYRAQPGDTVHLQPGDYYEEIETVRPGEPGHRSPSLARPTRSCGAILKSSRRRSS